MATLQLDTIGMRCPLPVLKLAATMPRINSGDVLEVKGDCETFDYDIHKWCRQMGKVVLLMMKADGIFTAHIQF